MPASSSKKTKLNKRSQSLKLGGFLIVDESRLNDLGDDVFAQWRARSWLPALYAHLASRHNWADLAQRIGQEAADHGPSPQPFDDLKLAHDVIWTNCAKVPPSRAMPSIGRRCAISMASRRCRAQSCCGISTARPSASRCTPTRSRKAAVLPRAKHASLSFYEKKSCR